MYVIKRFGSRKVARKAHLGARSKSTGRKKVYYLENGKRVYTSLKVLSGKKPRKMTRAHKGVSRKSPKRKSPKRKSVAGKRKSPKRKSVAGKRKSPKRKSVARK